MDDILFPTAKSFTFQDRNKPLPGDLRLSWRIPVMVLILHFSSGQKASLPKLHLLSDAVRNEANMKKLGLILSENLSVYEWRIRVEPALGRAIDFALAESLIEAIGSNFCLTSKGMEAAEAILSQEDTLLKEKEFLVTYSKKVTKTFVDKLVKLQATP